MALIHMSLADLLDVISEGHEAERPCRRGRGADCAGGTLLGELSLGNHGFFHGFLSTSMLVLSQDSFKMF